MRNKIPAWPLLLVGLSLTLLAGCDKGPTSANQGVSIELTFVSGAQSLPRIGKLPDRAQQPAGPLFRAAGKGEVEMVRVMVLDFSAFDTSWQYFQSDDFRQFEHARDNWPGDLRRWAEWRKLLGDFFRVVADQALHIEGDVARGTVTGVVGLNYLCVAGIEADTIRFWGEGEVKVREGEHAHAPIQVWDLGPVLYFLELQPYRVALKNGLTQRFRCMAYYSDGREVDVTSLARWSVRPGIAGAVDQTGLFLAGLQATGEETVMAFFEDDSAQSQVTVSAATLVLAEDFETYAVGAYPTSGGWEALSAGVSGSVSRTYAFSGAQSFRQESSPGHSRRDLLPLSRGDSLTFQVSVLVQEAGGGAVLGLYDRQAPPGGAFVNWIEFSADGNIYAARQEDRLQLQPYEPLTWYTVRVELGYPYANVYVNGELKAYMSYPSGQPWDALVLAAQDFAAGTSVQYYDDIRVTKP
ncbi:MAG: hypothetical protein ONB15_00960 [candidate division KSB1 bacterium]|nr:hypothetical protein [candidate division KSB1 bacterium]